MDLSSLNWYHQTNICAEFGEYRTSISATIMLRGKPTNAYKYKIGSKQVRVQMNGTTVLRVLTIFVLKLSQRHLR